jgi:hypothetical protein
MERIRCIGSVSSSEYRSSFPRIGAHVVAVDFPESRRVDVQLQRTDPLCALPEIELWNDAPARPAVVGLEVALVREAVAITLPAFSIGREIFCSG